MLSSFLDAVTPVSEWVSQWVGQWVTVSGVMLSHLRALLILMSRQFWYVEETKQADKLSCNCHLSFLEARQYQGEQLFSEENTRWPFQPNSISKHRPQWVGQSVSRWVRVPSQIPQTGFLSGNSSFRVCRRREMIHWCLVTLSASCLVSVEKAV